MSKCGLLALSRCQIGSPFPSQFEPQRRNKQILLHPTCIRANLFDEQHTLVPVSSRCFCCASCQWLLMVSFLREILVYLQRLTLVFQMGSGFANSQ
jgi:hypothetical protein